MTDTQLLLNKIAALRQRLEQAQGLASEATNAATSLTSEPRLPERLKSLQRLVRIGTGQSDELGRSLEEVGQSAGLPGANRSLPIQLSARARRVVEQGRTLLGRLRTLGQQIDSCEPQESFDPVSDLFCEARAMTNTALRQLQTLPDAALEQLRVCEGLEGIVRLVAEQLELLESTVNERRLGQQGVALVADVFGRLENDQPADFPAVNDLARGILERAEAGEPLRLLYRAPVRPAFFAAAHGWNTACVAGRLVQHAGLEHDRRLELVLAALMHDMGMTCVPAEVLMQPGPLSDEQRRLVEAHCQYGAEMARRFLPAAKWLETATLSHHERLDGTGYPDGLRDQRIDEAVRLLTVCDIYAAMSAPRPHRPARDPRLALTDTLLMAEQGTLDGRAAARLLQLSFYPVGTIVELADGSIARVVASRAQLGDPQAPARPVLAMLTDPDGRRLALPCFLDLAQTEGHSIVRALPAAERVDLLGQRYPAWV